MELNIKKTYSIIENITILYSISAIMIIFFDLNNFKIILDDTNFLFNIDNFKHKNLLFLLLSFNITILLSFLIAGFYIINLYHNKYYIFYYSLQSIGQLIKPIYIFYMYYYHFNKKLNISILFNLYCLLLNIISIRLIIRYKKIFDTIEMNK